MNKGALLGIATIVIGGIQLLLGAMSEREAEKEMKRTVKAEVAKAFDKTK